MFANTLFRITPTIKQLASCVYVVVHVILLHFWWSILISSVSFVERKKISFFFFFLNNKNLTSEPSEMAGRMDLLLQSLKDFGLLFIISTFCLNSAFVSV